MTPMRTSPAWARFRASVAITSLGGRSAMVSIICSASSIGSKACTTSLNSTALPG